MKNRFFDAIGKGFYYQFTCLSLWGLLLPILSFSQTISPSTINIAGNLVAKGEYLFEWRLGESVAINTMVKSNLTVTSGLLQHYVENQAEINLVPNFLSDEIRVGPNPVTDVLDINIIHAINGKHQIELLDIKGNKIREVQINYTGMGALQKWNLSGLPAGIYFLNIRQTKFETGELIKKGAYRIVKAN
jgi:Secretion system C-terminal sorting domain